MQRRLVDLAEELEPSSARVNPTLPPNSCDFQPTIMLLALCSKTSHLLSDCFSKQSKHLIRNITFLKRGKPDSVLDKSHHKIVYDFPGIRIIAAVLRTKTWIPPVSFAVAPILYTLDETMISSVILVLSASIYGFTGLIVSKIAQNTVGKIYVNKEGDVKDVLVSSVNKRGQRIDRIHDLQDIITYDFPTAIHRSVGFITVGARNSTLVYKVNVRESKFIDPGICIYLFGNIRYKNVYEEGKTHAKTNLKTKKVSSI